MRAAPSEPIVRSLRLVPLKYQQPLSFSYVTQASYVGLVAEAVLDDDGGRTRAHHGGNGVRGEAVQRRLYVGEDRHRSRKDHGFGGLGVAVRGDDDLVTGTDTGGAQHSNCPHVYGCWLRNVNGR
ncbi:hypothetical protein SALBM135S_03198 [Streptomyces alboniger]